MKLLLSWFFWRYEIFQRSGLCQLRILNLPSIDLLLSLKVGFVLNFQSLHNLLDTLFTVSPIRTEYVVTNDLTQDYTTEVQAICSIRWKIEEFHREFKQLTGVEACQCRKSRIQRNHIACAMLVWNHLKRLAFQAGKTIYQRKLGLLSDYLKSQLKNPSIPMNLA
jgi:Transposase DDE domain